MMATTRHPSSQGLQSNRVGSSERRTQSTGFQTRLRRSGMTDGLNWLSGMTGFIIFAFFAFSLQADYQTGLDAYTQGNYDLALGEWLDVARSPAGEIHPAIRAEACYAIAMLFWIGQGVPQDTSVAAGWLEQAAEMNHAGAQTKLGYLYGAGQGVQQSDFEAFKYFQMAANQGDPDAQYNLGVVYRDGLGVEANDAEALKWFREAAANGDAESATIVAGTIQEPATAPADDGRRTLAAEIPNPAPAPESRTNAPLQTPDETWIRARNPNHYTIQVIALQQPDKLLSFIQRNQDWAPFAIYQQEFKGDPLWIMVQGDYPDLIKAREAVRKFPTDIQSRERLWVRRFVVVQGQLP